MGEHPYFFRLASLQGGGTTVWRAGENASTPAEEGLEECIDTDTLVRCVLPRAGDSTFEWFRSAPDDAIEALVLPFDMDLVAAYEERPSDLVKCLVDAVQSSSTGARFALIEGER